MMTSYDNAGVCQVVLVKNHVRMGGLFSGNKESSKSYREGTAQKWKSMAQPYKAKVLKKNANDFDFPYFFITHPMQITLRDSKTLRLRDCVSTPVQIFGLELRDAISPRIQYLVWNCDVRWIAERLGVTVMLSYENKKSRNGLSEDVL